jgi:hypothetical protein
MHWPNPICHLDWWCLILVLATSVSVLFPGHGLYEEASVLCTNYFPGSYIIMDSELTDQSVVTPQIVVIMLFICVHLNVIKTK